MGPWLRGIRSQHRNRFTAPPCHAVTVIRPSISWDFWKTPEISVAITGGVVVTMIGLPEVCTLKKPCSLLLKKIQDFYEVWGIHHIFLLYIPEIASKATFVAGEVSSPKIQHFYAPPFPAPQRSVAPPEEIPARWWSEIPKRLHNPSGGAVSSASMGYFTNEKWGFPSMGTPKSHEFRWMMMIFWGYPHDCGKTMPRFEGTMNQKSISTSH